MSKKTKVTSLEALHKAMDTPGVSVIELHPDMANSVEIGAIGLSPVFADEAGRMWKATSNPMQLRLIGDWKR